MTLPRVQLREEARRALLSANTLAGPNVWTARSWPLKATALPAIQLQVLADHAESWGPSSPNFTRTAGLLISVRVSYETPAAGENDIETLCDQVEQALMLDLRLMQLVQRVVTIETELAFDNTSGTGIATARMRFDLEYLQTFDPPSEPLVDIRGTAIDQATGVTFATFDAALPQP